MGNNLPHPLPAAPQGCMEAQTPMNKGEADFEPDDYDANISPVNYQHSPKSKIPKLPVDGL